MELIKKKNRANNNFVILYKKMKAIYCFDDFFLGYRRGNIYRCSLNRNEITRVCKIPLKRFQKMGVRNRIMERAMHINPRGAVSLTEDNILLPMKGVIYKININTGDIVIDHLFRNGMNAPIELFKVVGIDGFDDGIIYGEYINDLKPHEISIYFRKLGIGDKWEKKFTFSKGAIQHVHTFIYGNDGKSLIMLTGDKPKESGIWRITHNFEKIEKMCVGSIEYRACVALETDQGMLYATDNPFNLNHMYLLKDCDEKIKMYDLEGTVINGKICGEELYFSTTIECVPFIHNWQVVIPRKRSKANSDNIVRIKRYSKKEGIKEIAAFHKDMWFMPLFQFGMVEFCSGDTDVVLCTPMAVKKYDNVVLKLK